MQKKKSIESVRNESSEGYTIKMWPPEIDGTPIESYDQLLELIKARSPGFFKRKDAPKLLMMAELHLKLFQKYEHRTHLERGEVAELSKQLKKSPTTLKRYLREEVMPRLYYWINKVPSAKREKKLEKLMARLKGVTSEEEYDRRFGNLYFYDEMSTTRDHRQYDEAARKFFKFIREYEESGLLVDLAKRLGIGKSTIQAWFKGLQLPTRIAYAIHIPVEEPRPGFKWLPKKLNHITNLPEDFIQVPLEIHSPQDILDVLNQLSPLDSKVMREFEKELGEMSPEVAFMYLLGLMVSDGSFKYDVQYSASANLFVSKKYSWGSTLGRGFCYVMGKIGLLAKRDSNIKKVRKNGKVSVFRVYNSKASPFLMWIKKALLGLKTSENKKYVPIKADWILDMPHEWKVAFIQGLADGDGHASIPRFDTAIATETNKKFLADLLSSVGIESRFTDHHVKIAKYNEILKAEGLPLFRFAIGRQKILNEMCKIIKLRPKERQPIQEDEKKMVMELHGAGLKPGEIVQKLWREHGLARTTKMIEALIYRESRKSAGNK